MKYIFTAFFCLLILTEFAQNKAIDGLTDSSFGNEGKVLTSFPNSFPDCAAAAALSDGSIITAGTITFSNGIDTGGFLALKYSVNGVLDTTFGNRGMSLVKGTGTGQAIAIQTDDKIIIGGYGANFSSSFISIARLNASGTLDSSFGNNGIILTDWGQNCHDIAIQKDGKILIFGEDNTSFITLRYFTNGTLDQTFGDGGIVKTSFAGPAENGNAIVVDPQGKIIVAGDDGESILLARYNPDGTLDQNFGQEGKVISNLTTHIDDIYDIALQPDGKIVAAGASSTFNKSNVLVVRYLTNGGLDSSFATNGFIVNKLPYTTLSKRLALQSDNKIVICGYAISDSIYGHFLTERYLSNGTIDSSFNGSGYEITEMDQSDAANAIIIQHDGKIVLAGDARETPPKPLLYLVALTRYDNSENNKQIIIAKIRRWIQHHNGIEWYYNNNNSSYIVQRSYDGIHFGSISRINADNNSDYTYADPSPLPGTNYYRLQTTSISGAVTNSNVIAITNDEVNISLSPNPAKNTLSITGLPTNEKVKITVVDFNGNVKLQTSVNNSAYNLDIASLTAGNYILKVETSNNSATKQFVKE